jgi:N-methylhydantoinase A
LDSPEKAIASERQVFFDEAGGFVKTNIYHFDRLAPGSSISGPAILEGMDSTVLINPSWTGQIDQYGNCIMEPSK